MVMRGRADFEWLAEKPADFLTRPGGWPETRYEAKARRDGHEVWYFIFRRTTASAGVYCRSRPISYHDIHFLT